MTEPMDPQLAAELQELYSRLHLTCARAASLLRLSSVPTAPVDELLEAFRREQATAASIWKRIAEVQGL